MLDLQPRAISDATTLPSQRQGTLPLETAHDRVAPSPRVHGQGGAPPARDRRTRPVNPTARPAFLSYRGRLCVPSRRLAKGWATTAKRALDITGALVGLGLLGLMLPVIAWLICRDSAGPIFFRQTRIGRHGHRFRMLKFRTMRHDACEPHRCHQARRGDPRITPVGAWLRRTSLDEWPQFVNVLKGEMSIVGPRPHAAGSRAGNRLFEDVTHRYAARHLVKPGMTGLAQIRGLRGETDTEDKLVRRVEADIEYIETWSLWLDLWIIWRTVVALPRMPNAH